MLNGLAGEATTFRRTESAGYPLDSCSVSALPAEAMAPPLGTGKEMTSPIQRQAGRNGLCGGEPPRRGV
jgi:hypothetical protein